MVTIFTTLKKNLWFGGNNLRRKRKKNYYSYHISATEYCITIKNQTLNKARRAEENLFFRPPRYRSNDFVIFLILRGNSG